MTRGTRLVTYAIKGEPGSGTVCINGAAAHGNQPGDVCILATFGEMSEADARNHRPVVVFVDERNRVVEVRQERPGPETRPGTISSMQ